MTPEDLLQQCRRMGLPSTDVHNALRALENKVLCNPDESRERKDWARRVLTSFSQSNPQEPGVIQAKRLLAICTPRPTPMEQADPGAMEELRKLLNPQDPKWLSLLLQVSQQSNSKTIRAYGERLVEMTAKAMERRQATRSKLLREIGPLLDEVLATLGNQLAAADRIQLKQWHEKTQELEREACIDQLSAQLAQAQVDREWDQVETLGKALQDLGQRETAQASLAKARAYRRWRGLLNTLSAALQAYHCGAPPVFPWDPVEPAPLHLAELLDTASGLEEWGNDSDRGRWRQGLDNVSTQILHRIQQDTDPAAALESLRGLRRLWPASLGPLPEAGHWEALEAAQVAKINHQFEHHLQAFRDTYVAAEKTAQSFLDNDAAIRALARYATVGCQRFVQEEQQLRSLCQDIRIGWSKGSTQWLDNGTLDRADHILMDLADHWGRSPAYRKAAEELQSLRRELEVLREAADAVEQSQLSQAQEILQSLSSEAARRLRQRIEQQMLERRIRDLIDTGHQEHIAAAELEAVSPEIQARYHAVRHGQTYVVEFSKRLAKVERTADFYAFVEKGLVLLSEPLPADTQLSWPDEATLEAARERLLTQLDQTTEHESEALREVCQPFPLLESQPLQALEKRREALLAALELPGFNRKLAVVVRDHLAVALTILLVQRACHEERWEEAQRLLQDPQSALSLEQRRRLRATVLSRRYLDEQADDSAWLSLYKEASDLLLVNPEYRKDYVQRVRRLALSASDLNEHMGILQDHFPEETALLDLLGRALDPQIQVGPLAAKPRPEDEPVLARLLSLWSDQLDCYRPLRSLWENLDEPLRRRVWNQPQSPLQRLQQRLERRLKELDQALENKAESLVSIHAELENYKMLGLLEESPFGNELLTQLDRALEIERRLRYLDSQDPWDAGWRLELGEIERLVEQFRLQIREQRGWRVRVQDRKRGIQCWDRVDDEWNEFRRSFDSLDTSFHRNPSFWNIFIGLLEGWRQTLEQVLPELNWTLPKALESERWIKLLTDWRNSAEGRLWQARREVMPKTLQDLFTIYGEIVDQTKKYAALHTELLTLTPHYVADPDAALLDRVREPFMRLRQMQPLTRPVQDIQSQLTNEAINPNIGSLYRRLFPE